MYAVIAAGGRQYKVSPGDVIEIERLADDKGGEIVFDKVLLVHDGTNLDIGTPYVDSGSVSARIVGHGRGRKIEVVKFKRRKRYLRRRGHRQPFTAVEITGIVS